ncbi:hypothetical protein ACYF6T_40065 [Streptomyces sp. 7R007]
MLSTPTVRVAWGSVLVLFPSAVLQRCSRTPPTRSGRTVVQVLGVRHIAQGIATARGVVPSAWAAVPDTLHAASMVALALCSRRWRTAALADAAVAGTFAVDTARAERLPASTHE